MLNDALLCERNEFPYDDEMLQKVIDREQIIRAQWQLDLNENWNKAAKYGYSDKLKSCRYLVIDYLPDIIEGIMAVLNRLDTKKARVDKQNIELLSNMPWVDFCAIAFQRVINSAIGNVNIVNVIKDIAEDCERETRWQTYYKEAPDFYHKIQEQQRRAKRDMHRMDNVLKTTMRRLSSGRYKANNYTENPAVIWTFWPKKGKQSFSMWLGALYLNVIIGTTGLFEAVNENIYKHTIKKLKTTKLFDDYIAETNNHIGLVGGYYLPLPCPPRDWTTTQCGGFWTKYGGQKRLIKNWDKGYQEEMLELSNELSENVFPAVNAAQHTAWRINQRIYEVLSEMATWKKEIAGLPPAENIPAALCPKCGKVVDNPHACFIERDKNNKNPYLSEWKAQMIDVHRDNLSLKSRRLNLKYTLDVVRILLSDERFYYVYQCDFRGRLYPTARLHPQGTDWQKALLEFADGIELGEHGAKWLAVHLANCYGYDKASYNDRVKWVEDNEQLILDCAANPIDNLKWTDADEPFMFLAACFEWEGYKREGKSYKSHCAVSLDGSCSGIQHYSAMLRDETGAIATNVKCLNPNEAKHDIYQEVADKTIELIQADIARGDDYGKYASILLANKLIDRKTVKRAVMTLPYGVRFYSAANYIKEALLPKMFSIGMTTREQKSSVCLYVSQRVWQAIPLVVQKAREGMDYLQSAAYLFTNYDLPITWKTPTGFYVQQSYYINTKHKIKLQTGGNIVLKDNIPVWNSDKNMWLTFEERTQRYINSQKQATGIAPNFIHSLDASHLMFSVNDARKQGITDFALVHDCLGTHAGNTELFSKIILNAFYKLYNEFTPLEDLTEHLKQQLPEKTKRAFPKMPEKGTLNIEDVKQAVYLFS